MRNHWLVAAVAALAFAVPAAAQDREKKGASDCPPAVKAGVEKAHPGAKIESCKEEKEDGKVQFEVKIETKDGKKLELDVSPAGEVLETEEAIKLDAVPAKVMDAFKKKYPHATARGAEKQTKADGKVFYEIAFEDGKAKREASFAADGTFEEEEGGD
jgi:uncharacterized membrane protein YkoI